MRQLTRHLTLALTALALAWGLAGCGQLSDALGLGKRQGPDEFTVVRRAPLVLPPNYNLRPPQPGAPRPQELQPSQSAREALISSAEANRRPAAQPADASTAGEAALMHSAGAEAADPNIRQIIEQETTALVAKSDSFTERLLFWRDKQPQGEIVDPKAEASRIRTNQATGKPVVEGNTPVIRHKKRGLLEGIF